MATSTYTWNGVRRDGRPAAGELEAESLQDARQQLRRRGIRVQKVRRRSKPLFSMEKRVKIEDIVFFTRQLATMMEAGVPIASSLQSIIIGYENESAKRLLGSIRESVETGTTLSNALKQHPKHFNTQYTSLVAVGEESGTLDIMMSKIAAYLEKMEYIKGKIKSAMFYPALVIVVSAVIIVVLLVAVIPEFEALFTGYGSELPALTRWIVGLSHFVQTYWYLTFGVVAGTGIMLVLAYRRSAGLQLLCDSMILRFPVFGEILRKATIARVSRTLATMFGAGVPLVEALGTVSIAAGNRVYTNGLQYVRTEVSTGRSLAAAMQGTSLFPGLVLQMVTTGEESGELERMLNKMAEFYESDVDNSISTISSLIEPFLIVFLGLIVGTIVIAMYLPIFKLGTVF